MVEITYFKLSEVFALEKLHLTIYYTVNVFC